MLTALLRLLQTFLGWGKAGWEKKNNPSVPQRADQIAKDYDAKRHDLENR
jgi:hypothetical protein